MDWKTACYIPQNLFAGTPDDKLNGETVNLIE